MSIELKMPALSPTMEKGTLAKWLVRVGDSVKPGDLIAEIETDKATMEFEAADEGTIEKLLIEEGTDEVPVGAVIALMGDGAAAPAPKAQPAPAKAEAPKAAPAPKPVEAKAPEAKPAAAPVAGATVDEKVNASPLAKRIAAAKGLALANIKGSGPQGRIVKADLGLSSRASSATSSAPAGGLPAVIAPEASFPPPDGVPHEVIKLSNMRKAIAKRLTLSKQTAPHFYLTSRCNLDALLKLRLELNGSLASQGIKLSVNDILIKAMGLAMIQVPETNVQFAGDQLYRFSRVDIAMAVAIPGGLITPIIRDIGAVSLSGIAQQSKSLAERARAGKLQPEDYHGGTASISNLGMFGVDEMFAVLNPPQALILGVGAGIEQPWKVGSGIGLATIMAATASFDHRAIDGAVAAQFMAALREFIEAPLQILV